ncbi:MAG: 16S rRNA (cytosine(967)-C(5))-methyltransferase RsmB [Phycisphaerae bacterium]|nr:16S rRNA (cytosine(967)-C(5))-methyltransferase RsmB [Phycisphaerae bacterium]
MSKNKIVQLSNNSARNMAVNALLGFNRDQKHIQDTLGEIFGSQNFDPRDKRLATELAYGVSRHSITLDHLIGRYSSRPFKNIDPIVIQILRIGLYQLLFMTRTPDFAAINEAVKQARNSGLRGTDGFVNALLRSVQREIVEFVSVEPGLFDKLMTARNILWVSLTEICRFKDDIFPDRKKNLPKSLSLSLGHPAWLIERWLKRFDLETVWKICLANNARPSISLRINPLQPENHEKTYLSRLAEDEIEAVCIDDAIQLRQSVLPSQLPGFQQGLFYVQDITAMKVSPLLGVKPGDTVLDMCAAPGGKTTHLAEIMKNEGKIIACDINEDKLNIIRENCQRLGVSIVQTALANELDNSSVGISSYDAILIDAPCSNTAVLSRRVEARHLLKPVHISRNVKTQSKLIDDASKHIKTGGKILYSTCSIDFSENEQVIRNFLKNHENFKLIQENLTLPGISVNENEKTSYWHDGGYTALLERIS